MYLRLVIAACIALVLGATHWKAYVAGKQVVKAELAIAVQKASEERRKQEQELADKKQQIEDNYAKQKKASDAVVRSTRNELDRLRDELRSYGERQSTASCPRIDADPRDTIIRECSEAAQSLARIADENGLKLLSLQSYVKSVCLKPL